MDSHVGLTDPTHPNFCEITKLENEIYTLIQKQNKLVVKGATEFFSDWLLQSYGYGHVSQSSEFNAVIRYFWEVLDVSSQEIFYGEHLNHEEEIANENMQINANILSLRKQITLLSDISQEDINVEETIPSKELEFMETTFQDINEDEGQEAIPSEELEFLEFTVQDDIKDEEAIPSEKLEILEFGEKYKKEKKANLDFYYGILNAANKNDFKTAYSYFYKAFEGYDSIDSPRAFTGLKYMLLSKIILNKPDDVQNILCGELAMRYAGRVTDALKAIAQSIIKQSLAKFQKAMEDYHAELLEDPIMKTHIELLFNTFMEKKICEFIKPYCKVEVSLVARIISLPIDQVKKKLSQMISDRKLNGYLDQDDGMLYIFKPTHIDADLRDQNCNLAPNETLFTAQHNPTVHLTPDEVVSIDGDYLPQTRPRPTSMMVMSSNGSSVASTPDTTMNWHQQNNNNSNIPGPSGCGQRSGLSMDGRDRTWPNQSQIPHIISETTIRADGRPIVSKVSNPPPLIIRSLNSMADQDDFPETDSNELTVDLMSSSKSNSGGHQMSIVQGRKQHSQNNPTVHLTPDEVVSIDGDYLSQTRPRPTSMMVMSSNGSSVASTPDTTMNWHQQNNNNSNIPGPSGCGQRSGLSMDGRDRTWPELPQLPSIVFETSMRSTKKQKNRQQQHNKENGKTGKQENGVRRPLVAVQQRDNNIAPPLPLVERRSNSMTSNIRQQQMSGPIKCDCGFEAVLWNVTSTASHIQNFGKPYWICPYKAIKPKGVEPEELSLADRRLYWKKCNFYLMPK